MMSNTKKKTKFRKWGHIVRLWLKYFLYFLIIQVLWTHFSNYQNAIDTRFAQLGDGIVDVASADADYIRRCHLIDNKSFSASEVYPMQNNIRTALNNYVKALYRLNGLISYSTYLKLHEFSYCYSNNILNNLQDGCNLYPTITVEYIDRWKTELLYTVEEERDKNLSFFTSIWNFFTQKTNKKYPMPTSSYGYCNSSISSNVTNELQKQ